MAEHSFNAGAKPKFNKSFGSSYNKHANYSQNNAQINNIYNPNSRNFNHNYDEQFNYNNGDYTKKGNYNNGNYDNGNYNNGNYNNGNYNNGNYNDGSSQNYYDNYEPNYNGSFGSNSSGSQQNYFPGSNYKQTRTKKLNGSQFAPGLFGFNGGYGPDFNQGFYESQFYRHQLKTFGAKIRKIKEKPKVEVPPPKVKEYDFWWTEECSVALTKWKKAKNKYRNRQDPENKINLTIAKSRARAIIKKAKRAAGIDPNPKITAMLEQREKEKAEAEAIGGPSNVEDNSDATDDGESSCDEHFADCATNDDCNVGENDQNLENLTSSILNEV